MEIKTFEIRVVKSATDQKHDTLLPQQAKNGSNFYHIQLLVPKQKDPITGAMSRSQKRIINVNIFNSTDQKVWFQDIEECLADEQSRTILESGDILIKPTANTLRGEYVEAKLNFIFDYSITEFINGKASIRTVQSQVIRYFVGETEDPEVRNLIETNKARKTINQEKTDEYLASLGARESDVQE